MKIRNVFGKAYMKAFSSGKDPCCVRYKTGSAVRVARASRGFIESFEIRKVSKKKRFRIDARKWSYESANSLTLILVDKGLLNHTPIASISIGFGKETIYVEALQGAYNKKKELNLFRREMSGTPWQEFLLREVEEHGKKLGFKKIKIRAPEQQYYYHDPANVSSQSQLISEEKSRISKLQLTQTEQKRLHDEYLNKLKTKSGRREEKKKAILRHQQRMRELYENAALARGYKKSGLFYIKEIK